MNVLIFGSSGALGSQICSVFQENKYRVFTHPHDSPLDSLSLPPSSLDVVVWAQGVNLKDSILDYSRSDCLSVINANVVYVLDSLNFLLANKSIKNGAKLCILSSIWQFLSRTEKLSYTISKSSLSGLVNSLAIDLGSFDIKVNLVAPGVVDTPMSRQNMSPDQRNNVLEQTPLCRLATTLDVANAVFSLCGPHNTFITGQTLVVDGGFSTSRIYK
ncbi:SDR family NAD(P)-dependent oxidoreductase [Synechococcus sp. KORDI-49]|uniref:SDR family NAD(P)-dependent oxidoreductase n=1 Tax=Synechococcus sp. KORDI-49 TaxID=585423 RepID=UPI0008FFD6E1|nr:SDR family oxidoreductase [Synechococcus sp. KORDI-49]